MSIFPRAKDVITEDDIKSWVVAGVQAASPFMFTETREALLFAMREHQKILQEQTLAMMRTMEAQSVAMQQTIARQGAQVSRLIAFGGLTHLVTQLWHEVEPGRWQTKLSLAAGYGLGVVAIICFV
eukprot:TRINITY_DN52374_c0_g1_i1.p1 TRINITY_DN52374_c0_g1~~TRINITY_DN52374_c0_g1_i1.p1  ORF type:complete len:126 (+),score=19.67 TRINITY_DN52374_c0_g1_i1:71-448(+)